MDRIASADIAKGIGIIAIVAGHVGLFPTAESENVLVNAVFQFHVPIFYLLAGYFLSTRKPFAAFAKQKAWRMLAPYYATCLAVTLVVGVLIFVTGTSKPPSIFNGVPDALLASLYAAGGTFAPMDALGITHIGAIWFLWALFIGMIEVRLVMNHRALAPIVVVGLFILSVVSVDWAFLPLDIQPGLFAGLYIYLGTLARRANLLARTLSTPATLALVVALCVCSVFFYQAGWVVYPNSCYPGPAWLGVPASLLTCTLVVLVSQLIATHTRFLASFLTFFGKNSIVVLAVHLVMLDCDFGLLVQSAFGLPAFGLKMFAAEFVLQLAVAALAIPLVQRVGFLRRIFYAN